MIEKCLKKGDEENPICEWEKIKRKRISDYENISYQIKYSFSKNTTKAQEYTKTNLFKKIIKSQSGTSIGDSSFTI